MDLSVIPINPGASYSRDQIAEAVTWMVLKGSVTKVQDITGIPKQTIHSWTLTEWWPLAVKAVQGECDAEVDAMTTGIIRKAAEESMKRLEEGEIVPIKLKQTIKTESGTETTETIEMVKKPVSGVDATKIGTFWFNTQRVLRNLPTSIPGGGNDSRLNEMARKLKEIERKQEATVVSEQPMAST
jgi:P2-related tail formation protein